jgi:drug/metabolite transporter (DMT)-like permease
MTKSGYIAVSLVITIGVLWGLNWPAVKYVLGSVPPWTFRAIAFSAGGLLLALIVRLSGERLFVPRKDRVALLFASLLTVFGFNLLTAFGQLLTETSKAAIIAFTMPMWAAILSAIFLGERIGLNRAVSLLLGMSGLAVLLSAGGAEYLSRPAGFLVMLGAAISWAGGTVLLKAHNWSIGPLARSAWLVGLSALPAIAGALALEHPWTLPLPPPSVMAVMAFHIIGPVAICYAAWTVLIVRLPAATAAIATLLIPVVGVLSSSALIGDELTPAKLLALSLIVASVAFVFVRPLKRA